ncbi:MAG: transcriptional regulator [Pseudomonadota bacterium]|nr:MAG: transcriptional regulator [Pseudomonadota bacterium]
MFRKQLLELLTDNPMTVVEIATALDEKPADIEADLRHLFKSLRHLPWRAVIAPARCRRCGFEFRADKLVKPGKCPLCRGSWVAAPRIEIRSQ